STWDGGEFPLLIKLIDAADRLSVQVHPDDALAPSLRVGTRGKTECWLVLADGGEIFVGLKPGTTREQFSAAVASGRVSDCLMRHVVQAGDFVFLPARTVHALGKDTLIYEVQQTCDVTFRVDDWGRVGLDGKPRQLHVRESLETIDFSAGTGGGLSHPAWQPHPDGGEARSLVSCAYFRVTERRASIIRGPATDVCTIVTCLEGSGSLATASGSVEIRPMTTWVVPACSGAWTATGSQGPIRLLISQPT
ncbi:MAG: type I phosphomannose isomerase catalytic subunit, partial [Planctomycetota bacterium]